MLQLPHVHGNRLDPRASERQAHPSGRSLVAGVRCALARSSNMTRRRNAAHGLSVGAKHRPIFSRRRSNRANSVEHFKRISSSGRDRGMASTIRVVARRWLECKSSAFVQKCRGQGPQVSPRPALVSNGVRVGAFPRKILRLALAREFQPFDYGSTGTPSMPVPPQAYGVWAPYTPSERLEPSVPSGNSGFPSKLQSAHGSVQMDVQYSLAVSRYRAPPRGAR